MLTLISLLTSLAVLVTFSVVTLLTRRLARYRLLLKDVMRELTFHQNAATRQEKVRGLQERYVNLEGKFWV